MLVLVPDTDVILAAQLSQDEQGVKRELFRCWRRGEFEIAYSEDTLLENAEKLLARQVDTEVISDFLGLLRVLGRSTTADVFHFRHYPVDPDDIAFLLCAVNAGATQPATYDAHLLELDRHYPFRICRPAGFLDDLNIARGGKTG